MAKRLWSPMWGWYQEGEEEEKREQSIAKAKQGLEELNGLEGKIDDLAVDIERAGLLERLSGR